MSDAKPRPRVMSFGLSAALDEYIARETAEHRKRREEAESTSKLFMDHYEHICAELGLEPTTGAVRVLEEIRQLQSPSKKGVKTPKTPKFVVGDLLSSHARFRALELGYTVAVTYKGLVAKLFRNYNGVYKSFDGKEWLESPPSELGCFVLGEAMIAQGKFLGTCTFGEAVLLGMQNQGCVVAETNLRVGPDIELLELSVDEGKVSIHIAKVCGGGSIPLSAEMVAATWERKTA